jgi:hypothetical protein
MELKLVSINSLFIVIVSFTTSLMQSQKLDPVLKNLISKSLEKSHSVQI